MLPMITNSIKPYTCQSTNVQKIGTGERVVSVATMGVFSKKINKSFKCKVVGIRGDFLQAKLLLYIIEK